MPHFPLLPRLLAAFLPLALLAGQAQAAYNLRYTNTAPGAMTFTGNTIGLDSRSGTNNPPAVGAAGRQSIGAYIAEGDPGSYSGHPVPSSNDWTKNRSSAVLRIPAGATVLYAELIWGGSYSYGGQFRTVTERNGNVDFITPLGTNSVPSDTATRSDLGTIGGTGGTCSTTSPPCFYVRSANVTSTVQALGVGNHTVSVGRIPATMGSGENNLNTGGWTLAVAYKDTAMAEHKMNIYVGAEFIASGGTAAPAAVTDFCTAPAGAQSGRLMASAMEGDSGIAGDAFRFGATNPPLAANNLSGTNNLVGNFFAGQINGDSGARDTSGSFGNLNKTPGSANGPARQGYDITNVPLDSFLLPNQTTAYAQPITSTDTYMVNALGIQIKVGQPGFPTAVKRVNGIAADLTHFPAHQTRVGDILTFSIKLNNSTGTASATNMGFTDMLPPGLSFVPGSFTRSNVGVMGADPSTPPATDPDLAGAGAVPMPGANPIAPSTVALPDIPAGQGIVVQFQARVDSVLPAPAKAGYDNTAKWTYQFQPCAGQPIQSAEKTTNPVYVVIPRLVAGKTVAPAGAQDVGSTLTYTVTMNNNGLAPSSGSTMADAIPAGTTYVAGSTTLNGTVVPDVSGAMPYATAAAINSSGQAAGVIAVGATATVTFQVTINNTATGTIANSAVADIDGPGGEPPVTTPPTSTTVKPHANIAISKDNGASSVQSGGVTTYTITVSNAGPDAANNAVVQDPAVTGLSCTAVTCPPAGLTGGATCPATLTIPALQGAGLTIPALPSGGSVQLEVVCSVTATGV